MVGRWHSIPGPTTLNGDLAGRGLIELRLDYVPRQQVSHA